MRTPSLPLVWLFDIDGTLLLTQGAGREAMSFALRDQFGVDDDLKGIPFRGRTDLLILADICERHGLAFHDGEQARFWDRVVFHMRVLMDPPRGSLLPGVSAMLDAVSAEPSWVRALLTGNVREMARIKLSSFGVYERFAWGAFGEEAADRDALAKLAVRRAAERHGVAFHYEDFRPGWQEGIKESKVMGLYRQQHCGCIYSEKERYLPKAKNV